MPSPHRHYHRIAWIVVALALAVVVFSAYLRLSHVDLACPGAGDCVAGAGPANEGEAGAQANPGVAPPGVRHVSWRDRLHRLFAALLGLGVLGLTLLPVRRRRFGLATVLGACAAVALAIGLYLAGGRGAAALLAGGAEAALLFAAWRWSNQDFARVATITLALVILLALLGIWTAGQRFEPVMVIVHLLGGMATFALLAWTACRAAPNAGVALPPPALARLRAMLTVGLALLVLQIALGGWISANQAALACGTEFPSCLGQWWPQPDFRQGFAFWRGGLAGDTGGALVAPARVAIHLGHRLFALPVVAYLLFLALRLRRIEPVRGSGTFLLVLLGLQVLLGINNVVQGLPLASVILHNAVAALLLFVPVSLLARLRPAA